jgi:hypothetical protein
VQVQLYGNEALIYNIYFTSSRESYGSVYPHSSDKALKISHSGLASPAGGTANLVY